MKKGAILLASSLAGSAMGTVCPTSMYLGSNLYENLMVAAVTDWSASGAANGGTPDPADKKATAAALGAALSDVTHGLPTTGVSLPLQNSALVSALNAENACGTCTYNFYSNIWTATASGYCSADPSSIGSYLGQQYVNWHSITTSVSPALNVVGVFQGFYCVSLIQSAIDAFNACANNGYDLRTGAISTICTNQDDFLNVDAQFGAYSIMMDFALKNNLGTPMPTDFSAAYSRLPCRSCFDNFVTNVHATYGTTWNTGSSAGLCAGGASLPYHAEYYVLGTCYSESSSFPYPTAGVGAALQEFRICAGIYNSLYTRQRFPPNSDDIELLSSILKSYQSVVTCSIATDPSYVTDNSLVATNEGSLTPDPDWVSCMQSSSSAYALSVPSDIACFKQFGHAINSSTDPVDGAANNCASTGVHGPFTADCLVSLNNNSTNPDVSNSVFSTADSALMTFYKCAGFKLDLTPTTCSTVQAATIDVVHKSFIPILEVTMKAGGDSLAAGKNVLQNADIMDPLSDLPCASCYGRLAAELSSLMQHNDIALCENPYSIECKESTNVVAALASFKTCSGFSLTNVSPSLCTDEEWGILQEFNLVHSVYDLVVPNNTQTLLEAKYDYSILIAALKSLYPTRLFKCDHCFRVLLDDLWVLDDSTILECEKAITSAECFSLATLALSKFEACSGQDLDWTQDVVDTTTTSTTVDPVVVETTTTVMPDTITTTSEPVVTTTKSSSGLLSLMGVVTLTVVLAFW